MIVWAIHTLGSAFRRISGAVFFAMSFLLIMATHGYVAAQAPIKQIEIRNYNSMEFNEKILPDGMRILGNVEFVHEDVIMTCDSAYFYQGKNSLDAFSNVRIVKNDGSVTITGDYGKYQGNIKFAEIWSNVVLVDKDATMKTQQLFYDMNTNVAYYVVGANIFNKGNDLVSKIGYYHRNINQFFFKKDVILNTPDYKIETDTLDYNVHSKLADFVGPTYIQNTQNDSIYCERGWYNTNDTVALFRQHAWMKSGSTTIFSDTLFYENISGNGRAFRNIEIIDTTNNIILRGQKGEYNKRTERAWLTDSALLVMINQQDSLFLHADSLWSVVDTAGYKIMKAYHHARFYSLDMQGKCDSISFSLKDSVIRMYYDPVVWTGENQMTADRIEVETVNQKISKMNLMLRGFIISQDDTAYFNQIKGRRIVGLFREGNDLYKVYVYEEGETVYYTRDGEDLTGANKAAGPEIVIDINDKKAEKITYKGKSEGEMIPINEFNQEELTLNGFKWLIQYRPVDKYDIFKTVENNKDTP